MAVHSQLAPLPVEVPFRLVSKTIGSGAYACIKKAAPLDAPSPIFAVKFIHKAYAQKHGRISSKQLGLEITLHNHLGAHPNIVQFFQSGEDEIWRWIAMELAEGGDLFDKIESDVGVGEDVAHAYFTQLISAIEFMHGKGVGHRDIKPENVLLSQDGNLKVADFGLATLFEHGGKRKGSKTSCGSPPYTAPEVVRCEARKGEAGAGIGYFADQVDIWSCGVVLFVLLVGNTPWDEPSDKSYEFHEYVKTNGHPDDELFDRLPPQAYDLLRGILSVDPSQRFTTKHIRKHPWFTRSNRFLKSDGRLSNPVAMATTMFETMKIDFSQNPFVPSSQSQSQSRSVFASQNSASHEPSANIVPNSQDAVNDAMDIDDTQPTRTNTAIKPNENLETPTAEITFDWERPSTQSAAGSAIFSKLSYSSQNDLSEEPAFSQFTPAPAVPISRTQAARRFADILGKEMIFNQFPSQWSTGPLLEFLAQALAHLGVPVPSDPTAGLKGNEDVVSFAIRAKDGRGQKMKGEIVIERTADISVATFVKMSGDPVEWRRLFKRVVVICKDAVCVPEQL